MTLIISWQNANISPSPYIPRGWYSFISVELFKPLLDNLYFMVNNNSRKKNHCPQSYPSANNILCLCIKRNFLHPYHWADVLYSRIFNVGHPCFIACFTYRLNCMVERLIRHPSSALLSLLYSSIADLCKRTFRQSPWVINKQRQQPFRVYMLVTNGRLSTEYTTPCHMLILSQR